MKRFGFALLCVFFLSCNANKNLATNYDGHYVSWIGSDTMTLPGKGIQISRPNDRWRVLENRSGSLLQFVYQHHGRNVVMNLRQGGSIVLTKVKLRKRQKELSTREERLLRPYLFDPQTEQGFKFFETHDSFDDRFVALGTNPKREILFLAFLLKREKSQKVTPFILEMLIPREWYHDFEDEFFYVANTLQEIK